MSVFVDYEPWSQEYRAWRFKVNEPLTFTDQQTHFRFVDGEQITKILFETIDGQKYGQIELDYDYLGYLSEERWRDLPSARVIRKFKYKFDIIYHEEKPSTVVQIWEFGNDGELISNVAVDMAPADQLYLRPPPRSNNILDEVDIIAKEIKESRVIVSGDTIVDQYNHCDPIGISQEDPSIVVRSTKKKKFIGGAAIVAAHAAANAKKVNFLTIFGNDNQRKFAEKKLKKYNVNTFAIIDDTRPTTYKKK